MGGGITVIKLGGSVITDKAVPYRIEESNIRRIGSDLRNYGQSDLVLVHGGGSVGHYLVDVLKLDKPSKETRPADVARLSHEMDKLTATITEMLLEDGIPVVSVPTHAVLSTKSGVYEEANFSSVRRALALGYVPLMKGDVVLDLDQGFSVFSGDDLAVLLATELRAARVIMLTDVDGVIGPEGKVIKTLRLSEPYHDLIWPTDGRFDVTGGLAKKLATVSGLADKGVKIYILNPRVEGRLLNALLDRAFLGTEVVA